MLLANYNVATANNNCWIQSDIPDLTYSVKLISCDSGQNILYKGTIHYDSAVYPNLLFDWPFDGVGDFDDSKSVFFDVLGSFDVSVILPSGHVTTIVVDTDNMQELLLTSKDLILSSTEQYGVDEYMFHLDRTMDLEYGDLDGDNHNGSLFDVSFYNSYGDAEWGIQPLSMDYPSSGDEMLFAKVKAGECYEISSVLLQRADICVQLDISEACENDNLIPLIPHLCRMSPLEDKVYLPTNAVFNILQFDSNTGTFITRNDLLECTIDSCFIRASESASYQIEYSYVNEFGQTDSGVALMEIQDPNSQLLITEYEFCENANQIIARANPEGGTLIGPGIIAEFEDGGEVFYFIDPSMLEAGNKYIYTYLYEQVQGSTLICSIESKDSVFILPIPDISIEQDLNSICEGNTVILRAINNDLTQNLTYEWYDDSGVILGFTSTLTLTNISSTINVTLIANSNNQCTNSVSTIVQVNENPDILCAVSTDLQCFGDSNGVAEITINGSNVDYDDYTIIWSNGANTRVISNLAAGDYGVSVTNRATGCESSCVVNVSQPDDIDITLPLTITSPISCEGEIDATIEVETIGGQAPFTYSVNGSPFQSSPIFSNLGAGDVTIVVRDANGCMANNLGAISEPEPLLFNTINVTDLSCFDADDGSISISTVGGTTPYNYAWSTGSTATAVTNLMSGNYSLTVTDANGCQATTSVFIDAPSLLESQVQYSGECINFDLSLGVQASGGDGAYTFQWLLVNDGGTGINVVDDFVFNADNSSVTINTLGANPGTLELSSLVNDVSGCTISKTLLIPVRHCFDLAIRKTTSTQVAYPGDIVRFDIEVFNQGDVDAYDIEITDYVPSGLIYNPSFNTSVYTSNTNDWNVVGTDILYSIDQLNANSATTIYIYLQVDTNASSFELINTAEITNYTDSVIVLPVDEDDPITCIDPVETDNDINDDSNGSVDNPCDDDQLDAASIIVCSFDVNQVTTEYCIDNANLASCFNILDGDLRNLLDPLGNGDGIINGDAGNLIASFHNSSLDATNNANAITPCVDSALTIMYARLVTQSNCIFAIPLRVEVNELPTIDVQPVSVVQGIGSTVTFSVSAIGNNLIYQWQLLDNGVYIDIPFATSDTYSINATTVSDNGLQVRVLVANGDHLECEAMSDAAILIIESDFDLYCNDLVNISLDSDCMVDISPDLILQGGGYPDYIQIVVVDQDGNIIDPPYGSEMIGDTFTVNVIDPLENNSCWSRVWIEDKLPPIIDCPEDITIDCSSNMTFAIPTAVDNCGGPVELVVLEDIYTELECEPIIEGVRTITYQAQDVYGNFSDICTLNISYQKLDISEVVFPVNIDNVTSPAFNCNNTRGIVNSTNSASLYSSDIWDLNNNNYPEASESGMPTSISGDVLQNTNGYCSLNISYDDDIIEDCGAGFIILRSWTIVDWCSGEIAKDIQKISVKDNEAPIVICTDDQIGGFSAELFDYECTLDWNVQAPLTIYDCSDVTWTIEYLLADENGQAPLHDFYSDDNISGSFPDFIVHDLPVGRTWLRYTVTDACGHITTCFTEVNVIDAQSPTAICDANTVATLVDGWASIDATSIDDGSHDNCSGQLTYGIRRIDGQCTDHIENRKLAFNIAGEGDFYEQEYFCCADTENEIMVEMMVVDSSGNYSSCMSIVRIVDKVSPIFENCPIDITIDCGVVDASSYFGTPIVSDNCNITSLTFTDSGSIDNCGLGQLTRQWTLTDGTGNQAFCSQRITVINQNLYNGPTSSQWPSDITLTDVCYTSLDPSAIVGGYPIIESNTCQTVASTYTDEIFDNTASACYQILRTWTVIDWCQYSNSTANNSGVWSYIQTIKVNNTVAPQLDCATLNFCSDDSSCSALINYTHTAMDDCTPDELLKWTYDLDINNDNIVDLSGQGTTIQHNLPIGNHSILWTVEDRCGNINTCSQPIVVSDCEIPTPYCLSGITTVVMPSTGSVGIWAQDFDLGSYDNCDSELTFSFSSDPTTSNLTFDCDQLGIHPLDMWITDDAGNQNYCLVMINIQSNNDSPCDDQTSTMRFAGKVYSPQGSMIDSVEVIMNNTTIANIQNTHTDTVGAYAFNIAQGEYDMILTADKSDDPMNGVSTLDLLIMQKHILGEELLDSPYKIIASDVNGSNSVSSIDLITLRKLILGVIDELPNGKSWCFLDNKQQFDDILDPWPIMEQHDFVSTADIGPAALDFIGVKIGDLNGSAIINNLVVQSSDNRSNKYESLYVEDFMFAKNEDLIVELKASDFFNLKGIQFSLDFDANILEFIDADSEILDIDNNNYHVDSDDTGSLALSWSDINNISLDKEDVLIRLRFKSLKQSNIQGSIFGFSNTRFNSEIYNDKLEQKDIIFNVLKRKDHFQLYQNSPNPFVSFTTIDFTIPEDDMVTLSVYSSEGKLVYTEDKSCQQGINHFQFATSEIKEQSGLFYYSIHTDRFRQVKSMVIIDN